jgi:uncharacterized protein YndB with AHSA1/START domain
MTEIAPVEVTIHLPDTAPDDAFRYFTDSAWYVQWMGSEAELDPVPGGVYRVQMPDGFAAAGQFRAVTRPHQIVFSWGFADDEAASRTKHEGGEPGGASVMPAGSTRVTVTFLAELGGTRLTLRHEDLPSESLREGHDIAWNTYLPRLAIRAAGGDPGADPHR